MYDWFNGWCDIWFIPENPRDCIWVRLVDLNVTVVIGNATADTGDFCAYTDVKRLRRAPLVTQYHAFKKSLTPMQSRHSRFGGPHLDCSLLSDDQRRRWKTALFSNIVLLVDGVPDRRL